MVAGHLQEKKGYFYMVLTYKDHEGKRKSKWISTKLPVKGNKKRAQEMLRETRKTFEPDIPVSMEDMLFDEFLGHWLEIAKNTIQLTTYASYASMCKSPIVPYFKDKKIKLVDLKPKDIQDFYTLQLKRVKASTVIHYHTIIHRSLKYAVKIDVIPVNPASKIERPRQERFIGSFYDKNEVNQLFEVARGTKLEIPILLGAFYGLRRSEAVGLKWSAIDFNNNTLIVRHTVTSFSIDGKEMIYASDSTKNKSSMRTLPLVPAFKEKLLAAKAQQESNRKLCGRSYSKEFLDYICVNELGVRIRPNYVTTAFPKLLEEHGLRKIRFHDLRHSCASLLLANNVPMKQIQDWLGHSDFATTANIYAHLDFNSKLVSAQAMVDGLNFVIVPKPEIHQDEVIVNHHQSEGEKKQDASAHT
jgi:integrase